MEYTQEQIDKLKSDPIVQLLSIVTGTPIDKMVSEIKVKSNKQCEELKCRPEDNQVNDDTDALYPLTKEDIWFIVNTIKNVHLAMSKFYDINIDMWNTDLGCSINDLIFILCSYINDAFGVIDRETDWINDSVDVIGNKILNYLNNE